MAVTKTGTCFPWSGFRAVTAARSGTPQLAECQGLCCGLLCRGKGATQQNAHVDPAGPDARDLSTRRAEPMGSAKSRCCFPTEQQEAQADRTELHFSLCRYLPGQPRQSFGKYSLELG